MNRNRALAGLVGDDIQGSSSPQIHEAEAAAHELDLDYRLIDLARPKRDASFLEPLLQAAESMGFSGLNVTHPYKEVAYRLVDELSEAASQIGSINTIVFRNGKRFGDNTDWIGFSENLKATLPDIALDRVALIGTGGGGLAVAYSLLRLGATELRLFDINQQSARKLQQRMKEHFPDRNVILKESAADAVTNANGMVNATPVGMVACPGISIDATYLRPDLWVADIVYFPLETELVRAAKKKGCKVCGGGGMAVRQAALSFKQFFRLEPDIGRMLERFGKLAMV